MIQFTDLRVTKDGKKLIIGAKVKEDSYYDNVYIDKIVINTEETFSPAGPVEFGESNTITFDNNFDTSTLPPATYSGIYYRGNFYSEDSNNPGEPDLEHPVEAVITDTTSNVSQWHTYKDILTNNYYLWNGTKYVRLGYTKEVQLVLEKTDLANVTIDNHLFYVYVIAGGAPESDCPCGGDNQTTLGVTMYTGHYYNDFMNYIREMEDDCNIPQGLIDYILRYKVLVNSINTGHFTQANTFFNKWFKNGYHIPLSNCNCGCYG